MAQTQWKTGISNCQSVWPDWANFQKKFNVAKLFGYFENTIFK